MPGQKYERKRPTIPAETRRAIEVEAGHQCSVQHCGEHTYLEIHHINGDREDNRPENLVLLCDKHHKMADKGVIDRKALKEYKRLLRVGVERAPAEDSSESVAAVEEEIPTDDLRAYDDFVPEWGSVQVFSYRMADTFPGLRGFAEIRSPDAAMERLRVLLANPLWKRVDGMEGYDFRPFWWFRGPSNNAITEFERLSADRCRIGYKEYRIGRIAAFRSQQEQRDFAYVEFEAEPPVGVYEYGEGEIDQKLREYYQTDRDAYVSEEYGVWQDHVISRAEYDDNAAVIDGRPTRTPGAQLRVRFLTRYNLIIAAKASVINQNDASRSLGRLLDRILMEGDSLERLLDFIAALPTNTEVRERIG